MNKKTDKYYKFKMVSIIIFSVIIFFKYLFPVVLPFIIGILLSYIFSYIVDWLEKYKVSREIGTIIAISIVFASIGWVIYYLANLLWIQIKLLLENSPEYIEIFSDLISDLVLKIDNLLIAFPPVLTDIINKYKDGLLENAISFLGSINYTPFLSATPKVFVDFIVILFTSYFFTSDKNLNKKLYEKYIMSFLGDTIDATKSKLIYSLWGYIKTQFILMFYIGIICIVGLFVLKSEYSVVLGISIAVIDALPVFGSGFFLWPISLYYLLNGQLMLAFGYMALYILLQITRQILQPKILGDQIDLHPLLALFSMYVGYDFIGVLGVVVAPILAIFLKNLLQNEFD